MLPDRVSNPGPLTYKSGALPTALRGPADHSHLVVGLNSMSEVDKVAQSTCMVRKRP